MNVISEHAGDQPVKYFGHFLGPDDQLVDNSWAEIAAIVYAPTFHSVLEIWCARIHAPDYLEADTFVVDDSDDIFAVEDWIYSAWLPLPHAHIQLPTGFAELDTAFWTGEQLIGVQVEQTGSIAKSKREKLVYLEEHHPQIKIISIPRDGLLESGDGFPSDLFGEDFSCFWKGLTLPQGPSPSKILMKSFNAPPTN